MKRCVRCDLYEAYDAGERHPNNCVKFLCNDGACPHDEEINVQIEKISKELIDEDEDVAL